MQLFLLTLDTIDIFMLSLFKSMFTMLYLNTVNDSSQNINGMFIPAEFLIKLSIKYQSYSKSTKIDLFEQKMCDCLDPTYNTPLVDFFYGH